MKPNSKLEQKLIPKNKIKIIKRRIYVQVINKFIMIINIINYIMLSDYLYDNCYYN